MTRMRLESGRSPSASLNLPHLTMRRGSDEAGERSFAFCKFESPALEQVPVATARE